MSFDYIIVGAGTAGCVLAERLTADGTSTVGHRSSYDAWPALGAGGRGFDELLPYFKRSENAVAHLPSVQGPPDGYTIGVSLMTPRSRGTVRLTGAGPEAPLRIDPGCFSDDEDMAALVRVVDASVILAILSANTNATVYAIAECAAELISTHD